MKRRTFLATMTLMLAGCSAGGPVSGEAVFVKEGFAVISPTKMDELNRVCRSGDEEQLQLMIAAGTVSVISKGTRCTVVGSSGGIRQVKIGSKSMWTNSGNLGKTN